MAPVADKFCERVSSEPKYFMSTSASATRRRASASAAFCSSASISATRSPFLIFIFSTTGNARRRPPTSVPTTTSAPGYVTTRPSARIMRALVSRTGRGGAAGAATLRRCFHSTATRMPAMPTAARR
jgi:hypothetical protein